MILNTAVTLSSYHSSSKDLLPKSTGVVLVVVAVARAAAACALAGALLPAAGSSLAGCSRLLRRGRQPRGATVLVAASYCTAAASHGTTTPAGVATIRNNERFHKCGVRTYST